MLSPISHPFLNALRVPPMGFRGLTATVPSLALLLLLGAASAVGQATYVPDCNDPDNGPNGCLHPTPAIVAAAQAVGYSYYVGHAEPTTLFFSNAPASGNNMQWKFKIPGTDPNPNQSGTTVANFELDIAHWVGLALCDPNSNPFGNCVPNSDTNVTATAGSAFLELQFYPPGGAIACADTSRWCANLHINTLQNINAFQSTNCFEPTTQAFVTTNGVPGGPQLVMNNGDTILVTIHDTANGLRTDITNITTGISGFMVASGANGFVHNANQTNCATTAFDFHPMFATAKPGQVVPWASLGPNVSFDFEIGHWQLCGDLACTVKPDPAQMTSCGVNRGVGGCTDSDLLHHGPSYQAVWPDGTASHPASLVLGSPDDRGVGPLSAPTSTSTTYNLGYKTITFQTTEGTNGAFYPFWSQIGAGVNCVFNFGNDNPGETNNFGKKAQYGTSITNPCLPGAAALAPVLSKSFTAATVPLNGPVGLNFTINNTNTATLTGLAFTDTLPAGLTMPPFVGPFCGGTLTITASTITFSGGTLTGGTGCGFGTTVTGTTAGIKNNVTSKLTSNETVDGAAAMATIVVMVPPVMTKAFGAPAFPINTNTSLTFQITNNNSLPLTGVSFTDTLPTGLVVATPNGLVTTCGLTPAVTATAGLGSVALTNGTIPTGTCFIILNVTGTTPGIKVNTTSTISSIEGGPGLAATAQTIVALPAVISKSFPVAVIPFNGVTTLTFRITNPNSFVALTQLNFNDPLPAGLAVANPNAVTNTCGGTVTAVAGSGSISLATGVLAASATCAITVNVTGTATGTFTNVSGTINSLEGGVGNTATAIITVGGNFVINYAANLTAGDSVIDITNTGANGAALNGPGFGGAAGNICVNVYAFSPDEQLVSCCSCLITPNGLVSLSVNQDLVSNTLTGVRPNSVVVKLVPTGAGPAFTGTTCTNSAALAGDVNNPLLVTGGLAFGTTLHAQGAATAVTEKPFIQSTLSAQELASITNRCLNIIGNGSTFGICRSCRAGGLNSSR